MKNSKLFEKITLNNKVEKKNRIILRQELYMHPTQMVQ
jgi:hypothetical protein